MSEYIFQLTNTNRFDLLVDGTAVGYMDFQENDNEFYITHVQVEPKFRGNKYGEKIVALGIEKAKESNKKIIPICGYAKSVIKRNEWN